MRGGEFAVCDIRYTILRATGIRPGEGEAGVMKKGTKRTEGTQRDFRLEILDLRDEGEEMAREFTVMELMGGIVIIAMLAGLLLPAVSKAKIKGQAIGCLSNTKQATLAWFSYTGDNGDNFMLPTETVAGTMGWLPTS